MKNNLSSKEVGAAPDYSKAECWHKLSEITKDVDTFYIPATEYIAGSLEEGAPDYATIGNADVLANAPIEYEAHASVFEDSTNVFMPYYRQAGLKFEGETWKKNGNIDAAISGMPYDDITAALDYYFENYNGGRPFIIAGHSQGSAMTKLVLKKYVGRIVTLCTDIILLPNLFVLTVLSRSHDLAKLLVVALVYHFLYTLIKIVRLK